MTQTAVNWRVEGARIGELIRTKLIEIGRPELKIRWEWNDRFTRRMGDAKSDPSGAGGRVRFSKPLWPVASEAERRETVLHELAHILVDCLHGRQVTFTRRGRPQRVSHGRKFKSMLIRLGGTGARTHSVDTSSVRGRQARFVLECPGCQKAISFSKSVRTKWIRRSQTRICLRCRTRIPASAAVNAKLAS